MIYFLFFLLGVFTNQLGYLILQMNPLYKFWKIAEYNSLKILGQSEVLRLQALGVLNAVYAHAQNEEEFIKISDKINKIHQDHQQTLINVMRKLLPYETNYKTAQEAFSYIEQISKKGEAADE